MDKRIDFTGGNPDLRLDQITIDPEAHRLAIHALLKSFAVGTNPNFIISGCVVTVGGVAPSNTWSMTSGYIFLNDEVVQVESQSGTFNSGTQYLAFSKSTTYNTKGDVTYLDGTPRQTWQENRGVITAKSSVLVTELDAINGDTIDEKIRTYIGNATETALGFAKIATVLNTQLGTQHDTIVTPFGLENRFATTVLKGIIRVSSATDITTGTSNDSAITPLLLKAYHSRGHEITSDLTYSILPYENFINITGGTGSVIVRFPANSTDNVGRKIRVLNGSGSSVTVQTSAGSTLYPTTIPDDYYVVFEYSTVPSSSGDYWICTYYASRPLACPYIYVNGEYVDEILRNFLGEQNYKEDTIDITNYVKKGVNIIKLSEEKEETTYIDYLIASIDGEDYPLFTERKILNNCDNYEFNLNIDKDFKSVTLKAKGYYII